MIGFVNGEFLTSSIKNFLHMHLISFVEKRDGWVDANSAPQKIRVLVELRCDHIVVKMNYS